MANDHESKGFFCPRSPEADPKGFVHSTPCHCTNHPMPAPTTSHLPANRRAIEHKINDGTDSSVSALMATQSGLPAPG